MITHIPWDTPFFWVEPAHRRRIECVVCVIYVLCCELCCVFLCFECYLCVCVCFVLCACVCFVARVCVFVARVCVCVCIFVCNKKNVFSTELENI